jgi:hypothetical protein
MGVVLLLCVACSNAQPTQVAVCVDATPSARVRTTELRVVVRDTEGDIAREGALAVREQAERPFPVAVPLVPEGDPAKRSYSVEVEYVDRGGSTFGRLRAAGSYAQPEKLSVVRLRLERGCIGKLDCESDETCRDGQCVSAGVHPEVWDGSRSLQAACASTRPPPASGEIETFRVASDGAGNFSTVAELNEASLPEGAVVRFRRGDRFEGHNLELRSGVTYEAYGQGPKPVIANTPGRAVKAASDSGVQNVVLRNLRIEETPRAAVWLDEGSRVITLDGVDFRSTCMQVDPSADRSCRTITAFHVPHVTVHACRFGTTRAEAQIFLFNADYTHVVDNDVSWPEGRTAISVARSNAPYVALNRVASGESKNVAIGVNSHKTVGSSGAVAGALVEHNEIDGANFGLSVRASDSHVTSNLVRDADNGLWVGASDNDPDVTGMVYANNVVVDCEAGMGAYDDSVGPLTEYEVRQNVFLRASEEFFSRANGRMAGSFHDNLVVRSGGIQIGREVDQSEWTFRDNYFFGVGGRDDTGPDPELDDAFHPTAEPAQGFGLKPGVNVGVDPSIRAHR